MSLYEERIAAIYEKKKDIYVLNSTAMVNYNILTKNFTVLTGKFINKNNNNFNIFEGHDEYVDREQKLSIKNKNKKYSIFIFNNNFVYNRYDYDSKTSFYDIFFEFTQEIRGIVILKEGKILKSFFNPLLLAINSFSNEQIDKMIDNKDVDETEENKIINNKNLLLDGGIQLILTNEDTKEMYENESINHEIMLKEKLVNKSKNINVKDIIDDINSKIIGQEDAIKTLVSNIYYNQVLIDKLNEDNLVDSSELDSRKVSMLLDGSTGTGKTAILKEIANKLDVPIDIVNANSFSETGYVGPTITDILSRLLQQANGNLELAERGIIVLDEIDKIASDSSDNIRDMKKGVQEELLSFISGGKYDIMVSNGLFGNKISFDTSKITFILSGAFTKLRESKIVEKEKSANGIGFNEAYKNIKREYEITPQDYIDYGLMREFFGRIKVLSSTKSYTIDDLKQILLKSKISPLKNLEKTVQMFGYQNISYNNEFINKVCNEAYQMNTGARGLQSVMASIQNKLLIDLINQSYDLGIPIEINENLLDECKKDNIRSYTKELVPKRK